MDHKYFKKVFLIGGKITPNFKEKFGNMTGGNSETLSDSESDSDSEQIWESKCSKYPKLPHILPATRRIIAIGDLHGDYDKTIKSLQVANVIEIKDDKIEWTGGDTVVVQVGDQVDSCRGYDGMSCTNPNTTSNDSANDLKILKLFTELHNKAQKNKTPGPGAVYSLLGNHELMNVKGDLRYLSYKNLFDNSLFDEVGVDSDKDNCEKDKKELKKTKDPIKASKIRNKYFKPGNKWANFLACTRQGALIIGKHLFVHAGIIPEMAKKYGIKDINNITRKYLLDKLSSNDNPELDEIINSSDYSPFWYRPMGQILPDTMGDADYYCQEKVIPTLELYNVNNIIIGHTPQSFTKSGEGINKTCTLNKNKEDKQYNVIRVDIGASAAFDPFDKDKSNKNREVQVLEILNDKELNILRESGSERIY